MRLVLPLFASVRVLSEDHCTSIVGGKGSTTDGSTFATHSNDCSNCDFRLAVVAAKDHAAGASRPVFDLAGGEFPRQVTPSRARIYSVESSDNMPVTLPMGHIPEVNHTFALYESSYALMNEKGLGIGESTCGSILDGRPKNGGGNALFCVGSLIQVALERCETARCAVRTMGDLAVKYGFYGEEIFTGEALTIVDASGDAWMWHVSAAYNGTSAVWVAQRIPDDHLSVCTNSFVIGEVPDVETVDFLFSKNIREAARYHTLWKKGPLHFSKVFGYDAPWITASIASPFYTVLRRWRIFDLIAPSAKLLPYANTWKLPFSVKVEKKLSIRDIMTLHQDFFEDSPFDLTKGVLAGPFGLPYRQECEGSFCAFFSGDASKPEAQIARGISIPRTSYVQISQSHVPHPKVWFAPDMPTTSVFIPLYTANIVDGSVATPYEVGSQKKFVYGESAWWAHDFVANWMIQNFKNMSQRYVYPMRNRLQAAVISKAKNAENAHTNAGATVPTGVPTTGPPRGPPTTITRQNTHEHTQTVSPSAVARAASGAHTTKTSEAHTTEASGAHATGTVATILELATSTGLMQTQIDIQVSVAKEWWQLASTLIVRYNDGFLNFEDGGGVERLGMDKDFLEKVGIGCNSVFAAWPYQEYNTFPYTLRDLQSSEDVTSRQPGSAAWTQCAPGTRAAKFATPRLVGADDVEQDMEEDKTTLPYLAIVLAVTLLCIGIVIGRWSKDALHIELPRSHNSPSFHSLSR